MANGIRLGVVNPGKDHIQRLDQVVVAHRGEDQPRGGQPQPEDRPVLGQRTSRWRHGQYLARHREIGQPETGRRTALAHRAATADLTAGGTLGRADRRRPATLGAMWAVTIDEVGGPGGAGLVRGRRPGSRARRGAAGRHRVGRQPGGPAAGGRALPAAAGRVADPGHGVLRDDPRARAGGHRVAGRRRGLRAAGRRRVRGAGQRSGRPVAAGAPGRRRCCRPPALPEAACTVWSNLVLTVGLRAGQTILIHGGASGHRHHGHPGGPAARRDRGGHRIPAVRAAGSATTSARRS